MKILVLGDRGMLGQAVVKYFTTLSLEVAILQPGSRFLLSNYKQFLDDISKISPDVIINCIGVIPQKIPNETDYFLVNSSLPNLLCMYFPEIPIIHASTDCVFSDQKISNSFNFYSIFHPHNNFDLYGLSKSLGEKPILQNKNGLVIRCSVIGFTTGVNGSGLLDWLKSKQSVCQGFTNHFWNGITTLEWAKIAYQALTDGRTGVIQPGFTSPSSKYQILTTVNKVFDLAKKIEPVQTTNAKDRTLLPSLNCAHIEEQLTEYRIFTDGT